MAIRFIDGFDHYTNVNLLAISQGLLAGTYLYTSNNLFRFLTNGLTGGCFQVNSNTSAQRGPEYVLSESASSLGWGAHIRVDNLGISQMLGIFYSTDVSGNRLRTVSVTGDGIVSLHNGTESGAVLATSPTLIVAAEWTHIEISYNTVGFGAFIEVRLNGVTVIRHEPETTTAPVARIGFCSVPTFINQRWISYDNFFIWDRSGTENTDFIGERNIYTLMPVADGPDQDWVPSTGTSGYPMVNGIPRDVTSFVSTPDLDALSSFVIADMPSSDVTVIGVQLNAIAQKTGTADAGLILGLESAGVVMDKPTQGLSQDEWRNLRAMFERDPATGELWTPFAVNNLLARIKRGA